MKTLQDQYKLILEGKGNKNLFLNQVKRLFPNYFNQYTDYNSAVRVLKGKRILTEETQEIPEFDPLKDMPNLFNYKDQKKIDNINFNEILKGFYCEMGDIDNLSKTVDELIKIVTDNLSKDPLYYVKNGQFGLKGIGYTNTASGSSKIPEEAKGKYKSSGMEVLKENYWSDKKQFFNQIYKSIKFSESQTELSKAEKKFQNNKSSFTGEQIKKVEDLIEKIRKEGFLYKENKENLSFKSLFEESLSFPDDWDSMEHPNYPEIQKGNKYGLFKTEENGSWNDGGGNIETGMVKSSDNIEDLIITAKEEYMNENNIEFDDIPLDKNGLPPGYHIDELNYDDVQQDKEANAWVDKQHGDLKEKLLEGEQSEEDEEFYYAIAIGKLAKRADDDGLDTISNLLGVEILDDKGEQYDAVSRTLDEMSIHDLKHIYDLLQSEGLLESSPKQHGDLKEYAVPEQKDPINHIFGFGQWWTYEEAREYIDNNLFDDGEELNDFEKAVNKFNETGIPQVSDYYKDLKEAWEGAEFDTGKFDDGPQPKIEVDNIDDKIEAIIHLAEKADTLNHRFSTAEVNDLYNNLEKEGLL